MKIESASIHNFKRFDELQVSFKNRALDEVSDRFLILGDNGAGKTTLLQAIALPLALASGQIKGVADFDWIGYVPGRFARWGTPQIELDVSFTSEELELTAALARRWVEVAPRGEVLPEPATNSPANRVRIVLEGGALTRESVRCLWQFRGRRYAQRLLETDPTVRADFVKLPGVFWFDQFRNVGGGYPSHAANGNGRQSGNGRMSFEASVARLRGHLNGWQLAQQSRSGPHQAGYLSQLRDLYQGVFPDRTFAGVEPMPGVDAPTGEDFYFLLSDGKREYDIVEMSAGEQAVFPILYEFVRQQIGSSVVLIDEIDLNLHPPAAQSMVRQLHRVSPSCQFIFTTHSEAVSDIIGPEDTLRLPGGILCL